MLRYVVVFSLLLSFVLGLAAIDGYFGSRIFSSLAYGVGSGTALPQTNQGLKPGDPIGAFRVTKIAGATNDSVESGQLLCYRCRYGSSPMVMVFARKASEDLDPLVTALEEALGQHKDEKLRAMVTLIGEDLSELKVAAEAIADRTQVQRIPIVVAEDATTGPLGYQLSPSDITVIIAQDSQVVATEVFRIHEIKTDKVLQHVLAMLTL